MKKNEKIKINWDLSYLYKNAKDVKIEEDLVEIEKACESFSKKYKKGDYIGSEKGLYKALVDYEILQEVIETHKPWWFFALKNKLNSSDSESGAAATRCSQRITDATNKLLFFEISLGKIDKEKQAELLSSKKFTPYKYFLQKIFEQSKYNLSEAEEQLISSVSQVAYKMWKNGQNKLITSQTIKFKNREISIPEAQNMLAGLPTKQRYMLDDLLSEKLKSISFFAESEINAIYNYKRILDEKKGFKKPYSSTVLSYEQDDKIVETLVSVVSAHFDISKRFYDLHAKLLKKKKLRVVDRSTSVGTSKQKFSFEKTIEIVKNAFSVVGGKYVEILEQFLSSGQIDVFPGKGKSGGAFCWSNGLLPTYVLLNHVDEIRSVETFAHEMGHAIHAEMTKSQPVLYRGYSTACAEVASTFFEQLIIAELEKTANKKERIVLLHNRIMGDISTIFRQIAFFNFELELHTQIREKGEVSKEEIANMFVSHLKSYMGGAFEYSQNDGYFFVSLSHIRNFFYVYTYAFGQIVSRSLFESWKQDSGFIEKIEAFLHAGSSMSPKDIFANAGIDITDPTFFKKGLKAIENDIAELEKLTS